MPPFLHADMQPVVATNKIKVLISFHVILLQNAGLQRLSG